MVQPPQVSPTPSAAPLKAPAGKVLQKQAGNDGTFASLLDGSNGNAAESGANSPASSGRAVRPPAQSSSDGQQAKPPADIGASQPSGASDAAQAVQAAQEQFPTAKRAPFPASVFAFLSRSVQVTANSGTGPARTASGPGTDTKNTKDAKSEGSQEATAPVTQISADASGSLAVLPAEIQLVLKPQTAGQQVQGGKGDAIVGVAGGRSAAAGRAALQAGTNAQVLPQPGETMPMASGLVAGTQTDGIPGVTGGSSAAGRAALQAGTNAQALPQPGETAPLASGLVAGTQTGGIPGVAGSGQGQAAVADGMPSAAESAPVKLAAGNAALGITVTDVRTHFAPEPQSAKLQARESPSSTGSSLSADVSAADAASGARQAAQPVTVIEDTGSNAGRSGGEAPPRVQADKPAVQSSEVQSLEMSAAPSSPSGQAVPSPARQIFDAIQSAMPEATGAQPAAQAGNPSAQDYQPLKTITIALQPDGLGTVSIQLSLKSSHLGVRVEASEAGTAQLLRQHDGDLTALLQSVGYTVSSIAVHAAPQQAPADGAAQGGAGGQGGFSTSNPDGQGAGGGSTGTEDGAKRQPSGRNDQREGGYERPDTASGDGSLYV